MSTTKPAWVTNDYGTSYDDLVKSWGHGIVEQDEFGSYQGDLIYLLRDGDRYGLLVVGYGSCSGCDELWGRPNGSRGIAPTAFAGRRAVG